MNRRTLLAVVAGSGLTAGAADESGNTPCTDNIGVDGYRLEFDGEDRPRFVVVTEHRTFGETDSTVVDLANSYCSQAVAAI